MTENPIKNTQSIINNDNNTNTSESISPKLNIPSESNNISVTVIESSSNSIQNHPSMPILHNSDTNSSISSTNGLSPHSPSFSFSYTPKSSSTTIIRLLLNQKSTGCLLGKRGDNINYLRNNTGV